MDNADIAPAPVRPHRGRPPGAERRRRFLPPQHGAWAMLAVPYLAGVIAAGHRWSDLPLLGAWIAGYLLSYFVFQAVKFRRPGRYRTQLILYAAVAAPLTVLVVTTRPQVLWYAPAYAALFAVNAWHAWRRQERALINDLAAVLQSCLMVPVTATIAGTAPADVLAVFGLCLAYFTGTVFYVKTMIRERGNPAYRRWSIGYHLLACAFAYWLSPWSGALFGWLVLRAALLPSRGWNPKQVGILEIANCVLLLACAALR